MADVAALADGEPEPVRREMRAIGSSAATLLLTEPEGADAIIDGILYRGNITSLGGYLGAGKTPFAPRMVRAILAGERSFLGFPVEQVPEDFRVAYLTQEPERLFRSNMLAAGITPSVAERLTLFHWDENFDLLDEAHG